MASNSTVEIKPYSAPGKGSSPAAAQRRHHQEIAAHNESKVHLLADSIAGAENTFKEGIDGDPLYEDLTHLCDAMRSASFTTVRVYLRSADGVISQKDALADVTRCNELCKEGHALAKRVLDSGRLNDSHARDLQHFMENMQGRVSLLRYIASEQPHPYDPELPEMLTRARMETGAAV